MLHKKPDEIVDWGDWDNFCQIVEAGGFTAASVRTGIPKSSISLSLARLEARLGNRLLDRTTRRTRVTDLGQTLFDRIRGPAGIRPYALQRIRAFRHSCRLCEARRLTPAVAGSPATRLRIIRAVARRRVRCPKA
uniref:LysR family transcriptional regulator n=1 Tax=Cupriavidus yeoncheonensis TaxID=1462994 RepID=UPI003F495316